MDDQPEPCPSIYPHDHTIRCEQDAGHPPTQLHCHGQVTTVT
jgi:hypothetical protein